MMIDKVGRSSMVLSERNRRARGRNDSYENRECIVADKQRGCRTGSPSS
jgi:hypothetical protein